MAQVPEPRHSCGRPGWSAYLLAPAWHRLGCCRSVGKEPMYGRSVTLSLPLFITLPFKLKNFKQQQIYHEPIWGSQTTPLPISY